MGNRLKGNSAGVLLFVAIIAGVAVFFLTQNLDTPNPIFVVQRGTAEFCPQYLNFNNGIAEFSVTYENRGADGSFRTTLDSWEVLSKYSSPNEEFSNPSSWSWFASKEETINFGFDLNITDILKPPEKIGIKTTMDCSKNVGNVLRISCGSLVRTCNYQKDSGDYNPSYKFVRAN